MGKAIDTAEIITSVRDGVDVSPAGMTQFARALADEGRVSDAQAGAFAMAVRLQGLTPSARVALTMGMRDSGRVLDWDLGGPVIDKHSTGGVGDCISLLLAPALAASGVFVPMISGRGLGHTGGTLDKLEAIPGVRTTISEARLRVIVGEVGCAIVGASENIAPADRRLYAIRDVTGTVASIDLITASILSKKLAAGLDALVLDVKCGSGAFMKTEREARELAEALVTTAQGAGHKASALITDMSQPCAMSVGNALEIMEVMEALTDEAADPVLVELTAALGGELLALSGAAGSAQEGALRIESALASGRAAERLGRMIAALGGPRDFVERWRDRLPAAAVVRDVTADAEGHVIAIDGTALGQAVVALGGGRRIEGARIDPSVGFSDMVQIGDTVEPTTVLAQVHAANDANADAAATALRNAISIADAEPNYPELILGRVT